MGNMQYIDSCRICKRKNIQPFFDLGMQPLANALTKGLEEEEQVYPLSLNWCTNCNLVQLRQTAEPKELFSRYLWVTATSKTAREHAEVFYQKLISRSHRKKGVYVLEVGSNDGTFLLPFLCNGYKVLGVDPAKNIVDIAQSLGVPTRCYFFGTKAAKRIVKESGRADIIFARNVLPHVANTRDFVKGLSLCLDDEGTLAVEVHYAKIILDELHYDSIYHEHLCYFTLKSLFLYSQI